MNIRRRVKLAHMSVAEVARRVGVARQTVYAWFADPRTMSLDHAAKLAEVLGCTVDELAR
jgi:transcriptional regulator with XRE-family HTH domain